MAISFKDLSLLFVVLLAAFAMIAKPATAQEKQRPVNSHCADAIDLAMRDSIVHKLVVDRIQSDITVLRSVECLPYPGPENFHYVHFDFDCAKGIYCILDPGLLVVVDTRRKLVRIADEWYSNSNAAETFMQALDVAAKMAGDKD